MLPDKLHWSIWALSRSATEQIELFPAAVPAAEELALEFEEHYAASAAEHGSSWNELQISSLVDLDKQLSEMSGQEQLDLWLSADSLTGSEWASVRELAYRVLVAFELQDSAPMRNSTIYLCKK